MITEKNKILVKDSVYAIRLTQGTEEWKEFRKQNITASDIRFLTETFVNGKKHYKLGKEEFFNYKFTEKVFDTFQKNLIEKGNLVEEIAEENIQAICDSLEKKSNYKDKFTFARGLVLQKDGWMCASLDYIIFRNQKIFLPVEIKYTSSQSIFEEHVNKEHSNYYQLAFQMIVSGSKNGIMLVFTDNGKALKHNFQIIDQSNKQYKLVNENLELFKNIHHIVCIKKENPVQSEINECNKVADKIVGVEKALNAPLSPCKEMDDSQKLLLETENKKYIIQDYISELEKSISKSKDELQVLETAIEDKKECIAVQSKEMSDYVKDVTLLEGDIANINVQIENIKALKPSKDFLEKERCKLRVKLLDLLKKYKLGKVTSSNGEESFKIRINPKTKTDQLFKFYTSKSSSK